MPQHAIGDEGRVSKMRWGARATNWPDLLDAAVPFENHPTTSTTRWAPASVYSSIEPSVATGTIAKPATVSFGPSRLSTEDSPGTSEPRASACTNPGASDWVAVMLTTAAAARPVGTGERADRSTPTRDPAVGLLPW